MSNRTSDEAKRGLDEGWARATEALRHGDVPAMVALFTDDATLIDPSMPTVVGRADLEKTYREILSSTTFLGMTHEQTELTVSGDLAVENGFYTQTTQDRGKAPTSLTARYLMVWKYVDGQWLVLRDATIPLPPDSTQG
jgi:uncharacterized protein (TIGR02246 family)